MQRNQRGLIQIIVVIGLLLAIGAIAYKQGFSFDLDKLTSYFKSDLGKLDLPIEINEPKFKFVGQDYTSKLIETYTQQQVSGLQTSYDEFTDTVTKDVSKAAKYAVQKSTPFVDPDPDYYLDTGDDLVDEGDYDGATDNYEKYVELEPTSIEGYCSLGVVYKEKGELEKAKGYLQKALDLVN